jgi:hypothetical protein
MTDEEILARIEKINDYHRARSSELIEKLKQTEARAEKAEAVSDMTKAICEGMRRVCAVARMINSQRPDDRMTQALSSYDIKKLNDDNQRCAEENHNKITQLEARLKEADAILFGFNRCCDLPMLAKLGRETADYFAKWGDKNE